MPVSIFIKLRAIATSVIIIAYQLGIIAVASAPKNVFSQSPPDPLPAPLESPEINFSTYIPIVLKADFAAQRVNVPYFDGEILGDQGAIFWFGKVDSINNYADVRVGYNDSQLYFRIQVFDRRLWFDSSPSPLNLADYDAISLAIDLQKGSRTLPHPDSYLLVGQLNQTPPRDNWQAGYRGNGANWISDTIAFTTVSGWRGNAPNDNLDDRGWLLIYRIPFSSLNLSGPPAVGVEWGLAIALHDRDDSQGTPITPKTWPIDMALNTLNTWGRLRFGQPAYSTPPVNPAGATTIRHNLSGAMVADAHVGGHTVCGAPYQPDFFSGWGNANYAGYDQINIQNQFEISDWPCFSKFYITFPLDAVPLAKTIISAKLKMNLFGNAGIGFNPPPQPSLIQVLTVNEPWQESTITWNNAPLAKENISQAWVNPVNVPPAPSGIPYEWDVSAAALSAYLTGRPLQLVLYSADSDYHSGKYFFSSDVDEWNAESRPTLLVTWGE